MTPSKTAVQAVLLLLRLCAVAALWQVIKQATAPKTWERGSDGQGDGDGSFDGDGGGGDGDAGGGDGGGGD